MTCKISSLYSFIHSFIHLGYKIPDGEVDSSGNLIGAVVPLPGSATRIIPTEPNLPCM